jgi:hypothetical protein
VRLAPQVPMVQEFSASAVGSARVYTTLDRYCVSRDTDQKNTTCKSLLPLRWLHVEGLITHNARVVWTRRAGRFVDSGLRTKEERVAFVVARLGINRPFLDSHLEKPPDLDDVRFMDFTRAERESRHADRRPW